MGVEGADTALLPGLLIQLLFPTEVGNLSIQGQEEDGEKLLVGPCMGRGSEKVQPEPQQELWKNREDAHAPESLSPEKGIDHSITQVEKDLGKFLFQSGTQNRIRCDSDQ